MKRIKFGTDGWRAIIGEDFTFANARIVSQAIADYFRSEYDRPRMIVGYDNRFLSKEFAETAASILAANGIKVFITKASIPTTAASFIIKKRRLDGGFVLPASHNPPNYNGIKIKCDYGGSAGSDVTGKVEKLLGRRKVKEINFADGIKSGRIEETDIIPDYLRYLKSSVDMTLLKKCRLNILVDSMHGTGGRLIEELLKGTKCKVTTIRSEVNPLFGGGSPEPVPWYLKELSERMRKGSFDIGIANDGDADRIAMMRPDGGFIYPHQILALLLLHFVEDKNMKGAVVKTISCTTLIDKICEKYGLKLYETPVGFKHVAHLMRTEDILIGGEESGGIGYRGYIPERDGLLIALLFIQMLAARRDGIIKIMKDIEKEYGKFYYWRRDTAYPFKKKETLIPTLTKNPPSKILGRKVVEVKSFDGIKFILDDLSWLILRFSGTESILRIYAEASSTAGAMKIVEAGRRLAFRI